MTPHVLDADQLQRQKLALYEEKINSFSHRMRGAPQYCSFSTHLTQKIYLFHAS